MVSAHSAHLVDNPGRWAFPAAWPPRHWRDPSDRGGTRPQLQSRRYSRQSRLPRACGKDRSRISTGWAAGLSEIHHPVDPETWKRTCTTKWQVACRVLVQLSSPSVLEWTSRTLVELLPAGECSTALRTLQDIRAFDEATRPVSQCAATASCTLPRSKEPSNPRNGIAGASTASCAGWIPAEVSGSSGIAGARAGSG
jgi:hypothetical protein